VKKKITVISGAYNEEGNIEELYNLVKAEFDKLGAKYDWEQIIIDNASVDGTVAKIREIAASDKRFKAILNTRNFGHIRSPYYGILQSFGDAVIYMASDLQDPPYLIPQLLEKWEQGYDIVLAKKEKSKESPLFFLIRKVYYKLLNLLNDSGADLLENCTGFGLYDKKVTDCLRTMREPYPYIRGLVCELGYKKTFIPFTQPGRLRGITKNNFYTLYDNAMAGFVNHTKVPLRLAALAGFVLSAVSLGMAFVYLVLKLLFWDKFPMGTAPVMISLFFFSSVQLFFIGIIGEYLGAVLTKVLDRPLVIEKERINF
jgi:glycosyltransferase involved in cell wall biosynthesis